MTMLRFARALGASLGLVLIGAAAMAAFTLPGVQGPFLGDYNVNPYTLALAINQSNQQQQTIGITAGTTQTQAGATQLNYGISTVATANSGDAVALPGCVVGAVVYVINAAGNAFTVFAQNPSTDTINGTAGATGVSQAASNNAIYICATSRTTSAGGKWLSIRATS
jgi:hypothetical protein